MMHIMIATQKKEGGGAGLIPFHEVVVSLWVSTSTRKLKYKVY